MTVSDAELSELLTLLERGRQAWIDGQLGFGADLDVEQDDHMTIFGPIRRGSRTRRRPARAAAGNGPVFHGGTGHNEVVNTIVSDTIVIVVLIERNNVTVDGGSGPQSWVLRTTQVFERRDGTWVRLHRHADPLTDRRSPPDTFAMARGADVH